MASKQRLIDTCGLVVKLAKRIGPMIISNRPAADVYKVMLSCIADAPTVDAVEVVRCEHCGHCDLQYPEKQIDKEPTPGWYCKKHKRYRRSDDFCSYGERRAE